VLVQSTKLGRLVNFAKPMALIPPPLKTPSYKCMVFSWTDGYFWVCAEWRNRAP